MWATLPLHKTFVCHAFPFPPPTRTGSNGLGFKKRKPPHLRVPHTNVVDVRVVLTLRRDDGSRQLALRLEPFEPGVVCIPHL